MVRQFVFFLDLDIINLFWLYSRRQIPTYFVFHPFTYDGAVVEQGVEVDVEFGGHDSSHSHCGDHVPDFAIQFSSICLLVAEFSIFAPCTPLLEEKVYAGPLTLITNG